MSTWIRDLKHSTRLLARKPGFTLAATLTLALGIGATTAIFSVVYGVLLRPLPYPNADRIVELSEVNEKGGQMHFADPNFEDIRSGSQTLSGAAEYSSGLRAVSGLREPVRVTTSAVSRDFFKVMGVGPLRGREFSDDDRRGGTSPVAVVSNTFWRQSLGATGDLSQARLVLDDQSFAVVGVMPPGFNFPSSSDIWIPRELYEKLPSRTAHNWSVVALLREGATVAQARAELTTIARRLKQQFGQDTMMVDVSVVQLRTALTRSVRPALLVLLASVAFLLLVACANVANLLLAHSAERERELAICAALGAERKRLLMQFVAESLLLSMIGGALGVITAAWGVDAILAMAPEGMPGLHTISVNLPVLLFALGISLSIAIGLGVITALRATAIDPQGALSQGGPSRTGSIRQQRFGRGIMSAQLAITVVLLVGAGLLGRSLLRVLSVQPGFEPSHVLTIGLPLPSVEGLEPWQMKETDQVRRVQFLVGILTKVRALPGVRDAGGANTLPLTTGLSDGFYLIMNPGEKPPSEMKSLEQLFHDSSRTGDADYCAASEGYFRTLGIPLLRGRLFDERDTIDAPHVAVISESLAKEKWPGQDPLERQIEFGNMDGVLRLLTIVGVVGDVRESNLEAPPRPTVYVNVWQRPQTVQDFSIVLRTDSDPAAIFPAAREILRNAAPEIPPKFDTLDSVLAASTQSRRFNVTLVSVFAVTALLLALVGIFGVMAYTVSRRTREFGIRIALGAKKFDMLRLVIRQALVPGAVGVGVGAACALALTRLIQSLLFDVRATDPIIFLAAVLLLLFAIILASYLPARRATQVDPMVALRHE